MVTWIGASSTHLHDCCFLIKLKAQSTTLSLALVLSFNVIQTTHRHTCQRFIHFPLVRIFNAVLHYLHSLVYSLYLRGRCTLFLYLYICSLYLQKRCRLFLLPPCRGIDPYTITRNNLDRIRQECLREWTLQEAQLTAVLCRYFLDTSCVLICMLPRFVALT